MAILACALLSAGAQAEDVVPAPGLTLLEAVRLTLERDPNVALVEARVEAARGSLAIAQSAFDPTLTTALTQGETRTPTSSDAASETRSSQATVGLATVFRSGLTLEPELSLAQTEDLTAPDPAVKTGTLTVRLSQPLLRGRGREVTTAGELAAARELAAAELDLRHTLALRLSEVATRYWVAAAAVKDLAVLAKSEASSRTLLETTRQLIAADQVPAAELVQLEANLAAKESATLAGERALFTARQELGREIGLDAAEIRLVAPPSDPFPEIEAEVPAEPEGLLALAAARRADLAAAEERRRAAEHLRRGAQNALLPALDLLFTPSYSGLDEGSAGTNLPGASAALTLSLELPLGNQRAEGELLRLDAAVRQSELARDLIAKTIGANLPAALDAVAKNAARLGKAKDAVRLFERAVVNEEKKLKAGTSTLLDLISQRDRLTSAEQSVVAAELALALALLDLRFETGTLFAARGEAAELQHERLTTLPKEQAP